ncbi:translation elongation factor Ts [Candidatus Giovannonibacteria bacterium]|nr:translation elongation factor Ts [Candidatus Giovannonibacteria bacterium]
MPISADLIQKLRTETGVSVMACKRALERAEGDLAKALEYLKEEGALLASKKSSRETKAGIISSYVHGGKIGVLVELKCETDFVARNPEFQNFAREIAMQIAAVNPVDLSELLESLYIRKSDVKVSEWLREMIQKFGENIEIARFYRLEL